ncbi:MAG: hypothetical protein DSY32_00055 [Aquifex sp.]|nr:MAG: hypothetical protein DSY32_00055 [Aquifex sp.]
MAGISIELRRILKRESLISLISAAGYSALLSSGNWVIAIASIFTFSTLAKFISKETELPIIYQVYITYTIAISLILSGPFQLMFTRYVADRLFEKDVERVLPNFFGALSLSMSIGLLFSFLFSLYLFQGLPYYYHTIFTFTVATLCGIWVTNALLVGLKSYKHVLYSFLISYLLIGIGLLISVRLGIFWSFFSFYLGQVLLVLLLIIRIIKDYPSNRLFELDFLSKKKSYYSLAFTGFLYNLAVWIDKFLFWFNPLTGERIFGNIRASVIYDQPVIIAYLTLVPGLAIFFLKIEAEFFLDYDNFYRAVGEWGTLEDLYRLGNKLVDSTRAVYYEALRSQGTFSVMIFFLEDKIFSLLKIPLLYTPLFNILMVGTVLQLAFMVLFAILSYFDRRKEILYISLSFASLNFFLTLLSQHLGPYYYGYGFSLSLLFSVILGMYLLGRFLNEILYRTYVVRD